MTENQKEILKDTKSICDKNDVWWIPANPIAKALGKVNKRQFITAHILEVHLKNAKELNVASVHPFTKFINRSGLEILLKNNKELLDWIINEKFILNTTVNFTPVINLPLNISTLHSITVNRTVWILAKPLAKILGYADTEEAIQNHVTPSNKHTFSNLSIHQDNQYVNEGGLHELLLKSRKKQAKDFKGWLFGAVLPSLHRSGKYELKNAPEDIRQQFEYVPYVCDPMLEPQTSQELSLNVECSIGYFEKLYGEIEKIEFEGTLWLLAEPFINALGYSGCMDTFESKISTENQREYEKIKTQFDDSSCNINKYINEAGLYELINNSKRQNIEIFKTWVTNELLPNLKSSTPMMQDDNDIQMLSSPTVTTYNKLIDQIVKIYFNGSLWMLANPFAETLGYSNCSNVIRYHVSPENQREYREIQASSSDTYKNLHGMSKFINEDGLYELINNSKNQKFKSWIVNDFLPTLESHDKPTTSSIVDNDQFLILKKEMEEHTKQICMLVASMNNLVDHCERQHKVIESQRNIIQTSLQEQKMLMTQFDKSLSNQEQQILTVNNQIINISHDISAVYNVVARYGQKLDEQILNVNTHITSAKNEILNIRPSVTPKAYNPDCLEVYFNKIEADMFCYHALRTKKCLLDAARLDIQWDFKKIYYSEAGNVINNYNSIKDRIHFVSCNVNKIFSRHSPTDFIKAINGEFVNRY